MSGCALYIYPIHQWEQNAYSLKRKKTREKETEKQRKANREKETEKVKQRQRSRSRYIYIVDNPKEKELKSSVCIRIYMLYIYHAHVYIYYSGIILYISYIWSTRYTCIAHTCTDRHAHAFTHERYIYIIIKMCALI